MFAFQENELRGYLATLDYRITRKNKIEYLELSAAFDIESSSTRVQETKFAFMYEWTFGIAGYICYGRTWDSFLSCLKILKNCLKLNSKRVLIIWVHNLAYEFQFMCKYLEWDNVFALEERKPIKALTTLGIEFRCSYVLSGLNLALTAKNLTKHKLNKKEGDLDYSLVRHEKTQLTEIELGYCEYDVLIVLAYIDEQRELYTSITRIPLTNTGRVREYVRNCCLYSKPSNHKKSSTGKYTRYRNLMNELTLTNELYQMCKQVFQGGFTHANYTWVGKTINDVTSIDFTSSYPAVMLSEKFPMSKGTRVTIKHDELVNNFNNPDLGYLMYIHLWGVQAKVEEMYISSSKCLELKAPVINNGRVCKADYLVYPATEIDYKIIRYCYDFSEIRFSNVYQFIKDYLPRSIVLAIIELYKKKTQLKGVAGEENEYLLSKGMLNSIYGMSVTDVVKDNTTFTMEWGTEKVDPAKELEKYNKSKNRVLYYPWGVWVTAYARANLWNGIINIGHDYIYSDTDSIKLVNYARHKKYVDWYNQRIAKKLNNMCEYHNIDINELTPITKQGVSKPIGVWDFEGTYKKFKTLGAKRYIYYDDELHITVAGLSKKQGRDYLVKINNGDIEQLFNNFNDDLYIPANETGKSTHTYIDEELEFVVKDYKGEQCVVKVLSSVHLEPCEFTLSLSKEYGKFLREFSSGYLKTGDRYE